VAVTKKLKNGEEEFTKPTIKKYLKKSSVCPFCGKDGYIESEGREERDFDIISCRVSCSDCKKRWWEIYTLTSIDTVRT
jgi:hypothetical protein